MRRIALLLVLAAALAAAASAEAKGPITIEVCGAKACAAFDAPIRGRDPFGGTEPGLIRAAPPGPYYRLVLGSEGERWTIFYVPSADALAVPYREWINWHALDGVAAAGVRRLARTLDPIAGPIVTRAQADGSALPGAPSSYLRLLAAGRRIALPGNAEPIRIRLAGPSSPWANVEYLYYPDRRLMQRGLSDFVRVSPELAARIEGRSPAAPRDRLVWPAASVAALVLIAGAVGVRRQLRA